MKMTAINETVVSVGKTKLRSESRKLERSRTDRGKRVTTHPCKEQSHTESFINRHRSIKYNLSSFDVTNF